MGNPIISTYAADPHADLLGDRYYVYATNAGVYSSPQAFHQNTPGESHGFAVWSSSDLTNWRNDGSILRFTDIPWAKDLAHAWAPCIAERNGLFYFYFCADSRIGVAVGESPTGPFLDVLGEPLVSYRTDLSSIDPMVFIDDDGEAYFYWGAVPATWLELPDTEIKTHLSVRKLNKDMVSFDGPEIPTIQSRNHEHIEATHVFKRNGIYYLTWSPGSFYSDDDQSTYRVHYATSSSPLGPWKTATNNPVLSSWREVGVVGPGHHSTIQIPGTDIWYCVYHCHKGDADRRVFIDRMKFAADGSIQTIVPTLAGAPAHPVRIYLSIDKSGPYGNGMALRMQAHLVDEGNNVESLAGNWKKVEYFTGATIIGETSFPDLSFDGTHLPKGFHRLWARAYLSSGEVISSAAHNIDVI